MRNRFRLVITGGPGVGKHTNARLVAKKFPRSKIIDINKLAIINNAFLEDDDDKYEASIDVKKIGQLIDYEANTNKSDLILVGHLAPYVINPERISIAIVLRRSPYELISVFQKRNYSPEKARENIASEILGITFYDSLKWFGKAKVAEIDTTGQRPLKTLDKIVSLIQEKSKPRFGFIDWLTLVTRNNDLHRFLEY